jgi:hypothetical protein
MKLKKKRKAGNKTPESKSKKHFDKNIELWDIMREE